MNNEYKLQIAKVRPLWIRVTILIFIGLPPITGWPLTLFATASDTLHNIFLWLAYGLFIWLFILLNVGLKQLTKYLSFAFSLAIITCLIGATLRKVPGLFFGETEEESMYVSYKMLSLFICMISVIPFSLFFINCFSVSSFVSRLQFNVGKRYRIKVHLALALRVFQHVGDVTVNLLDVWREENPLMIKPRFSDELNESKFSILGWLTWLLNSAITWSFAMMMHTFEAIPYLSEEMKNVINYKQNNTTHEQ